jgi:acetoin utilization deacetylase AcuC-like enzyme
VKDHKLSLDHKAIGDGEGRGYNVNIPLLKGFGDSEILYVFDELLEPLVKAFEPEMIIVSAGFDAGESSSFLSSLSYLGRFDMWFDT